MNRLQHIPPSPDRPFPDIKLELKDADDVLKVWTLNANTLSFSVVERNGYESHLIRLDRTEVRLLAAFLAGWAQ